ncbi:unnamed protein product [Durusdinium trenchii]|uniref:Uncharacterized protein n=1 Tax=Durusdinium trenchii TaxID=1381693 RepID=A0ABP0LH79_9DINO
MAVAGVMLFSLVLLAAGETKPTSVEWNKWIDRLGTCLVTCLVLMVWRWCSQKPKEEPKEMHLPAVEEVGAGWLMQDLEKFEQLTKQQIRSVNPRFEASLDEARAFVRVLCMGMGTFDCSSRVVQPQAQGNVGNAMTPVLVVKNCKLFGDFATRSRIPFNVVSDDEVAFQVQSSPPTGDCPFRCKCHAPCFGPASRSTQDGQPLGGAWAQVVLEADGQLLSLDAAPQVFAQEVSLAQFRGKPVVLVPKNDVSSVKLRGAVAVLSEKHKPGTMSDGALLRGAYQAGAEAVIKIGGGGAMLYCVPDPSEIPCFAISEDDGKKLCSALEAGGRVTVKELIVHDRREKLQAERWKCGNVWLHVSGLYLQSVDWDGPLWEVAQEARAAQEALIYEDYFEAYQDTREVDPRLGLERSKLRRMMESAWSQLGRIGLTKNASMIGKLLALGAQRCKLKVNYLKFHPAETFTGTACAMLLSPHKPGFKQKPASDSLVQAWVAHEAVYLALMGHFTKLIDYMAPSLWNLIKCMNGEFFGWEADASKIRKLFTACTGPFGPVPRELWQQRDPTWRITDERNAVCMVVRTQGRLLWSKDATAAPMRTVLPKRSGPSGPTRPMLDFMSRMAQKLCCTL